MAERETGQPDAVDGSGVPSDGAFATSFLQRAVVRRRVRFLRRRRELALHDLGGFVFESHRLGEARAELLAEKLAALGALDDELATLQRALDLREELTVLREPGIASCAHCGAIHDSAANFCPSCGVPAGTAAAPQEQAAFEAPDGGLEAPQRRARQHRARRPRTRRSERAALEEPAADTPQQQSALEAACGHAAAADSASRSPRTRRSSSQRVEQPPADTPHAADRARATRRHAAAATRTRAQTPAQHTAHKSPDSIQQQPRPTRPAVTAAHEEAPPQTDGEAAPLEATQ